MEDRQGKQVPEVTFRTREDGEWKDLTTGELFKGKTVVVFSLPGAFTPTCSSTHLPRYEQLAQTFRQHGVDDILCVSVNDGFVMEAWGKDQGAEHVKLIPDGNGAFTEGMGMLVDKSDLGFGKRSWRYSMLVKDGVVDRMFIEPDEPGDPFKVSDADTMLAHVAPDARPPQTATMFARPGCPHCARAKVMLRERGIEFEEIVLGTDITTHSLEAATGRATTPQVFIGGEHIGGADDLEGWLAKR